MADPFFPHDVLLRRRTWALAMAAGLAAPWRGAAADTGAARFVVGYPAGGSVDTVARTLADVLGRRQAGSVVVENRPGASGRLAVEAIRQATGTEHAVLVTPTSVLSLYPHVFRQLSYDPFTDLVPLCGVAVTGFVLAVGPAVPVAVNSLADLLDWCRQQPHLAQCGNAGMGSLPHFLAMWAAREFGLTLAHVPYRGGFAAMQAAANGEVALAMGTESAFRAAQPAARMRAMATWWPGRSPFLPHTPSFTELGWPALVQQEWFGLFLPRRAHGPSAASLAARIGDAMAASPLREVWRANSLLPEFLPPDRMQMALRNEFDVWGPVVKASGFTPDS